MIEIVTIMAAQQATQRVAHEALPHAPVQPERSVRRRPQIVLRQRLCLALRRIADLIEPFAEPAPATPAGCR